MKAMQLLSVLMIMTGCFLSTRMNAQNKVGLLTDAPDAPVHIHSSGQVNAPGGLVLLGDRSEGHMEIDFDLFQSRYGALSFLPLRLQPMGGNVGINTFFPDAPLHLYSSGQVNYPGGLLLLGNRSEAHMEMDFDLLQSRFGAASYLPLRVQPDGGNLNVGAGLIFADHANRFVGINTDNPVTELQVHGEMRMTTAGLNTSQKDKIAIHGQLEEPSMLGLGWLKTSGDIGGLQDDNENRSPFIDTYEMYYRSGGAHRWFINEEANVNTPSMILNEDGDLGLGPSVPESKFHITGGYGVNMSAKGYAQFGTTTSTNLVFDNNEILARNNGSPSTLFLQYWGGHLSLADHNDGKVAIGHNAPISKLHVTDGVSASPSTHGFMVLGPVGAANLVMDVNSILARNNGFPSHLYIQNEQGNLYLCGEGQGRVGIGTTSLPFDQDFILAVDGKMIAEEVRVQLSGDWPDYVFTDNYALRPLPQLAREIRALGHLPGMPSAAAVQDEGIDLGEIQRRLLEKVEELTLYVIALDATNTELREEIAQLKKAQPK